MLNRDTITNLILNDYPNDFLIDPELDTRNPDLLEFLSYCTRQRGERKFAGRGDIHPRDILRLLPKIHMHDVEGDSTFRIRLIGTRIEAFLPRQSNPGSALEVLPSMIYSRLQHGLEAVMKLRAPLRTTSQKSVIAGHDYKGVETIFVPLSDNDTDINIIIAITSFSKG
ncbi:MAG: PAS domain-containing protein [Pseudomonadota bacterium]